VIGSRFIATIAPSQFLKVAAPAPRAALAHAHPAFTRFMASHPGISRFIAEHPAASRFVFRAASHIPGLTRFIPIAPHVAPVYNERARKPRRPTLRM
jgi:hypothetical protein